MRSKKKRRGNRIRRKKVKKRQNKTRKKTRNSKMYLNKSERYFSDQSGSETL